MLGIDPGTIQSGYVILDNNRVTSSGTLSNPEMLALAAGYSGTIAIEMVASYGMAVGKEVFETVRWIGRFQQASKDPEAVRLVYRRDVKIHLCGSARATDQNIRAAIIDAFGMGKDTAVGRKSAPGPLYAVKGHAWSALAVALTAVADRSFGGVT